MVSYDTFSVRLHVTLFSLYLNLRPVDLKTTLSVALDADSLLPLLNFYTTFRSGVNTHAELMDMQIVKRATWLDAK